MERLRINLKKVKKVSFGGVAFAVGLAAAVMALCYILLHNPHQSLHQQIFKTAKNINHFYRDQPNYWKLSTQTAIENGLVSAELLRQKGFELRIGQGENGEMAMPNDNSFDIALRGLNKSACINLSEFSISKKQQLSLQKITINNDAGQTEFTWGGENPLPIKSYATRKICQPTNNVIIWTFQ